MFDARFYQQRPRKAAEATQKLKVARGAVPRIPRTSTKMLARNTSAETLLKLAHRLITDSPSHTDPSP